jgi:hypothetical protein
LRGFNIYFFPSLMHTWTLITQYDCFLQRYAQQQQQHIGRHPGVSEMSKCISISND